MRLRLNQVIPNDHRARNRVIDLVGVDKTTLDHFATGNYDQMQPGDFRIRFDVMEKSQIACLKVKDNFNEAAYLLLSGISLASISEDLKQFLFNHNIGENSISLLKHVSDKIFGNMIAYAT